MHSEINALLRDPQTPISRFLSIPSISRYARGNFPDFQSYFVGHSATLLQLSFSDEKSCQSIQAFKILSCGDPQYLQPVIDNGDFQNFGAEILAAKSAPPWVTGRLSTIALVALLKIQHQAFPYSGFIFRLLHYCENPTVYNLFETLTGDDEMVRPAQEWLRDLGFGEYIIRELENLDFGYDCGTANVYKDPIYNRVTYFFDLISRSCDTKDLSAQFQCKPVINCLRKQFPNAPDFVRVARWRAIVSVTCQRTAVDCLQFIPEACRLLTEPFANIREFRVSALCFVTRMMEIAPLAFDFLLQSQMPQMLMNLVVQFPNSTILHNAFLRFVELGVTNQSFVEAIVMFYVPVALDIGARAENKVLQSCCLHVMNCFLEAAKGNSALARTLGKELDGVAKFAGGVLKNYLVRIETPYGGPLPPPEGTSFRGMFGL
jgi:hypothetical protein